MKGQNLIIVIVYNVQPDMCVLVIATKSKQRGGVAGEGLPIFSSQMAARILNNN